MKRKLKNRKTRARRACRVCANCNKHSFVLGLLHDIGLVVGALVIVFSWPVKALATLLHDTVKHYPALRSKHVHTALCLLLGIVVLVITYYIQEWSHRPAWGMAMDTAKATGAAPIWEALAGFVKVSEEV